MSQYILIIRNEGNPMAGLNEEQIAAHMQDWGTWMGGLAAQGKLDGGLPLNSEGTMITNEGAAEKVYVSGQNTTVGGYVLINAESKDEAVEISKTCPALQSPTGSIELRECLLMEEPA